MSFVSWSFLLFLAVVIACNFVSPRRVRWCVLLAASYVFYWFLGGWFAMSAVSFTILTVYASGLWAGSLRRRGASRKARRAPLAVCLTLNFGLLLFFKYSSSFVPSLGALLIPGISFYTFQASGYLIDIYKGKVTAERNPLKLALFLSFFPQLIQGPISRHSEIASDLFNGNKWDWERARSGIQKIIWGYFMKMVVADRAALLVGTVFDNFTLYGGVVILLSIFVYSVQIYADFSGGINIAVGVAEIIGVKMPENFRQPFFANSLSDFWRRWHITLGSWFKDYLFYPIALSAPFAKIGKLARKLFGKRTGKMFQPCLATFVAFFAIGIWHGTGAHIMLFGLLNGVIISAALFMEPLMERMRSKTRIDGRKSGFGRVFAALRTLALLMFLRYFARASSLGEVWALLEQTALHPRLRELWNGMLLGLGLNITDLIVLSVGTVLIFIRDFVTETGRDCGKILNAARPALQFIVLFAALLSIVLFGIYSGVTLSATFIYAQY